MTTHDDATPLRPSHSEGQTGWTPQNPHHEEAQQRWGHTDAWKQSQDRVKKMSRQQFAAIGEESGDIMSKITALAQSGKAPANPDVQEQIDRHYNALRHFYEPNIEMYRGLADMYVADERFAAHYNAYNPGLATFMRDAMHAYCDATKKH